MLELLDVKNLRTHYLTPFGAVKAIDGISFKLKKGIALGFAGESGCGKTTVALSIMRILPYPGKVLGGEMLFKGTDIMKMNEEELRQIRWKGISTVFQGAMASLNPLFKVGRQIADPIMIHEDVKKEEAYSRANELLELVGIDASRADNYPWELSGGMRQRVMIAMGLACNPDVIIADEPTTALDVIVAHQVMELIRDLREKLDLSMMLITHDISVIAQTCDELAIMYAGKIVELSTVSTMFESPLHPYTDALISSFPNIKGERRQLKSIVGNPPDLINPPSGCKFNPRCPYTQEICRNEEPSLDQIDNNHGVACHFWEKILAER
jgi:peptide/nickel transport system ATP-binding protein